MKNLISTILQFFSVFYRNLRSVKKEIAFEYYLVYYAKFYLNLKRRICLLFNISLKLTKTFLKIVDYDGSLFNLQIYYLNLRTFNEDFASMILCFIF